MKVIKRMKISIIMPTYNDSDTIKESLESVLKQTITSWELIVVDDGSTDITKQIVEEYSKKDNRIKYIYQENRDQLNAINNGFNYATGEYISILHSDDLFYSADSLKCCIEYLDRNKDIDAIISDLVIIDKEGKTIGKQTVHKYSKKSYILPLQQLWLGRNLFIDVAIHRRRIFEEKVKENYVMWNTPFWIDFNSKDNITSLNVKKVDFNFYKYRIDGNNYINSYKNVDITKAQLNVINGELRTLASLIKYYNIPFYKLQYIIFRIFNKLKLFDLYRPIYFKSEQRNKAKIFEFVIKKKFGEKYIENIYLKSLVDFYKNYKERSIEIDYNINEENVYWGKDNSIFNENLLNDKLDKIYIKIFEEMKKGFDTLIVKDDIEREKVEIILRFLCIHNFVNIEVK